MSSQWIERPSGVWEVIGSNPVEDSDFFSLSHARDMLITSSSHLFTKLKIYHLSFFTIKYKLDIADPSKYETIKYDLDIADPSSLQDTCQI